ncbi:hypothetical protein ACFL27_04570 [candidate division CSSED10-310 bacterium]|uniref:Uncharacterized protein n=1 Tax=candidate division CSSED10-310 bacterium TaxID=2855610 RepID=A0ABV6YTQ3_UNCC1
MLSDYRIINIYRATGACPQSTFNVIETGHTGTTYVDTQASGATTFAYKVTSLDVTETCESGESACADATVGNVPTLFTSGFVLLILLLSLVLVTQNKKQSAHSNSG